MAVSCEPNDLTKAASCFQCLSEMEQAMVQTYLLAIIAGVEPSPEPLLAAATQFQALSDKELLMVQAYLLCKISGG